MVFRSDALGPVSVVESGVLPQQLRGLPPKTLFQSESNMLFADPLTLWVQPWVQWVWPTRLSQRKYVPEGSCVVVGGAKQPSAPARAGKKKDRDGSWKYTRSFDAENLGAVVSLCQQAEETIRGLQQDAA